MNPDFVRAAIHRISGHAPQAPLRQLPRVERALAARLPLERVWANIVKGKHREA